MVATAKQLDAADCECSQALRQGICVWLSCTMVAEQVWEYLAHVEASLSSWVGGTSLMP